MKIVAAYLLAVLGGNESPTADDLKSILGSVGAVPNDEKINLLLSRTNGETLSSLIRSGNEKMVGAGIEECSSSSGGAAAVPQGGAAPPPPGLGAAAPSLVACATRGRRVQVPRMVPVLRMTEDGHEYDDMWVDVYRVDNIWDLEASAIAEIRDHALRVDIEDAENYAIAYELRGYFHYPTAHDLEADNVPWAMIRDNLEQIDGYDRN